MAAVGQRVLNWLYSVLTSEYKDVNRTYNDTAQALSQYPSLKPKTEVYTYENGASALLLQLSGTLPVSFRGTTYRFPVTIWIPHHYPRVEPMIYVTPADGMMVRTGQYVDPQGRVYHPYLANWPHFQDKSNIHDFLAVLRDVFAKEPPVVSRQAQSLPISSPRSQSIPPPVPPLPTDVARSVVQPHGPVTTQQPQPPPPPPKPHATQPPVIHHHASGRANTGPPLPPLPPSPAGQSRSGQPHTPHPFSQQFQKAHGQHTLARQSSLRYESAPPLPPQPKQPPQQDHRGQTPLPYSQPPSQFRAAALQYEQRANFGPPPQIQPHHTGPLQQPPAGFVPNQQRWQQTPQPQQPKSKARIIDLLDDSPVLSPPPQSNLPVPPVPRNPEKDALLHQIAQQLFNIRQADAARNATTLQSLAAQRDALNKVLQNLHHESASLSALQSTLGSNTHALTTSLASADQLIAKAPKLTPPSVDELLVAPTVVANQLYDLVAEERAIGDTIFNLGRAVEKGRIEPSVFVKQVRGLARELYGKKALIRKAGEGMGLDDGRESVVR